MRDNDRRSKRIEALRSRRAWCGAFLSIALVLTAVFLAFELPRHVLAYTLLLLATVFLGFFTAEILRVLRRTEAVERAISSQSDWPEFPDPVYAALTRARTEEQRAWREAEEARQERQHARNAYTTLWAHQIKTPLAALYLLAEDPSTKPSAIKSPVLQLEEYVDQMLGYERLESASTDYRFQTVDPEPLLRKSIRKYASQCIRRGIAVEMSPLSVRVITDEKWFAFLFEQILSNAVKYTKNGTISIDWKDGSLRVRDTGMGIPSEDLPRVFEMGFTGRNGRAERKSTGIGLALCDRISRALSLRLTVESAAGEGTCVAIGFPAEQIVADAGALHENAARVKEEHRYAKEERP